jgi:hypothetical protein
MGSKLASIAHRNASHRRYTIAPPDRCRLLVDRSDFHAHCAAVVTGESGSISAGTHDQEMKQP